MLLAAHAHTACPASWFQQVVAACYNSACSHAAGPWPHLHAPEAAAAAASVAGAGEDALGSPLMLSGGSTRISCAGQSRVAPLNPAGTQHHLQHAHAQQHVSSSCAGQTSQSCYSAPAHRPQLKQQSRKRQQGPVRASLLRQNKQAALPQPALLHTAFTSRCCSCASRAQANQTLDMCVAAAGEAGASAQQHRPAHIPTLSSGGGLCYRHCCCC